jgi:glycosyltransferase involved in cell wall biosynthesis
MSVHRGVGSGPGIPGLVSVVIASYNRGYIVAKAIESVLAQTYRNIEVLVADDGSRDDTRTVVEAFGEPVRWVWQANEGLAGARNLGLRHARGEFIAVLDSDDAWLPWKLEAQIPIMQRLPELALVGSDMTAVDATGRVLEERHLRTMYTAYQALSAESIMSEVGTLGQFWAAAPGEVASAPVRVGDLFPHLLHGSLIQPSTS